MGTNPRHAKGHRAVAEDEAIFRERVSHAGQELLEPAISRYVGAKLRFETYMKPTDDLCKALMPA
jgi:hypothetical protein